MSKKLFSTLTLALVVAAWGSVQAAPQSSDPTPAAEPVSHLVLASDVEWGPLNPARGDKGSHGSTFRAVVIQGQSGLQMPGENDLVIAGPGSYFGSQGEAVHQVTCQAAEACIYYLRTQGAFDFMTKQEMKR